MQTAMQTAGQGAGHPPFASATAHPEEVRMGRLYEAEDADGRKVEIAEIRFERVEAQADAWPEHYVVEYRGMRVEEEQVERHADGTWGYWNHEDLESALERMAQWIQSSVLCLKVGES